MTVPFDPKPSEEVTARILDDQTVTVIVNVVGRLMLTSDWHGCTLTAKAHRKVCALADMLRDSVAALDALTANSPVHRMVDGDLWHREPAVMTAGDLGIEEKPR